MAWLQTLSGIAFDLAKPDPRQVDFENDIAPALSKLARFTGHTQGDVAYSVAQHCVLGAESLAVKTGSKRLGALFLLHDAHEAYIGDMPTPFLAQLDEDTGSTCSPFVKKLKARLDWAILMRAGIQAADETEVAAVKYHDIAMMNAERFALKKPAPESWGARYDSIPAAAIQTLDLQPWESGAAREEWLHAFTNFVVV